MPLRGSNVLAHPDNAVKMMIPDVPAILPSPSEMVHLRVPYL